MHVRPTDRHHFGRQVFRLDQLRGRHHGEPVADVLELAHVAREVEGREPGQRRIGDALGLDAQLARALLQEVARERGHVFAAFAQRGQAQADHVEAVEQVFAEAAELHALLEILVGGGDDAHIGLHRVVAAHAVEVAVAEHAQEARLQVEGHVADFVEEQRAALGLLEAAAAHGLRAGEGAALVAEEFALEQVLGNGGGVDRHEGAVGARRVLVQRARHQLLARARFAGDEHRDVALRQPADGTEHVLHRGRLAEHFGRGDHALFGHFLALAFVDGAADEFHSARQVEGLGQVLEGAALEGRDRAVEVGERGHDDDRQAGVLGLDLVEQVEPRAARHADVAHQDLRALLLVAFGLFECGQHFACVREAARGQVFAQQCLLEHEAYRLVVINYPDRLHASPLLPGLR
ncbi:hypothetical protein D9M68_507340 [compost metagenome]